MLSDKAQNIIPYVAGEQPQDKKYIKLNTNENPYPPSKAVYDAVKNFDIEKLRLYPDPNSMQLKRALAFNFGMEEKNIFVGNGSDEVLSIAFLACFNANALPILFPDITYSFYTVYCKLYDINYKQVPLESDFTINIAEYLNTECEGIVLANPNAPTAIALSCDKIENIIKNCKKTVIVDEAYIDFSDCGSVINLTKKYDNLLVVRTFSKSYSLAGIRCGYAVGNEKLIEGLEKIKNSINSYPVDAICEQVAKAALCDSEYFEKSCNKVVSSRKKLKRQLEELGVAVTNSQTNFLFIKTKQSGLTVYEYLRENGILVRHWDKPKISDWLRVTIGSDFECEQFLKIISQIV